MNQAEKIPEHAQLVVIGAGPGGYAAAFKAAELGLAVTLIDPEINPGGVCLYRGCIPSKALLHVAKLVSEAEESVQIGVEFTKPTIDVERVRSWKNEVGRSKLKVIKDDGKLMTKKISLVTTDGKI